VTAGAVKVDAQRLGELVHVLALGGGERAEVGRRVREPLVVGLELIDGKPSAEVELRRENGKQVLKGDVVWVGPAELVESPAARGLSSLVLHWPTLCRCAALWKVNLLWSAEEVVHRSWGLRVRRPGEIPRRMAR
jgi:hypothetical protein